MSNPLQWLQDGITQAFGVNGETGVDIGTPFGTPITSPVAGKVTNARGYGYGGEVDVQAADSAGNPLVYGFLHLSDITAKVGQAVGVGTVLGYSGGTQQGTYKTDPAYSNGPHTEFDLWSGVSQIGVSPFAQHLPNLNPTPVIDAAANGLTGTGNSLLSGLNLASLKQLWDSIGWFSFAAVLIMAGFFLIITDNRNEQITTTKQVGNKQVTSTRNVVGVGHRVGNVGRGVVNAGAEVATAGAVRGILGNPQPQQINVAPTPVHVHVHTPPAPLPPPPTPKAKLPPPPKWPAGTAGGMGGKYRKRPGHTTVPGTIGGGTP